VSLEDRRYVLDGPRATIGRAKETDCVLRDPNVSRRHAELRRNSSGDWQIVDLGSTNGVKVNGRRVDTSRLAPGDDVSLGTVAFTFDIEQ
jgi:pSer/pThr/pTyr-binding forkhead associated (FHA) protein